MKNKSFIYLAILFISLLTISTVSASEIDDAVMNEEMVDNIDTGFVSSVDTQSVDDSEENFLNENSDFSVDSQSVDDSEEKIGETNNIHENRLSSGGIDSLDIEYYDTDEYSNTVIEIHAESSLNYGKLYIYVNNSTNPKKTYKYSGYFDETGDSDLYITTDDLNLNYGIYELKVEYIENNGRTTRQYHTITNNLIYLSLDETSSIFEDLSINVYLKDEITGKLNILVNNKSIGAFECDGTWDYYDIPKSNLKIGKNNITVSYQGTDYPYNEASGIVDIRPETNVSADFISTGEKAIITTKFLKDFTGTVYLYSAYYLNSQWNPDVRISSAKIVNGVSTIEVSNLSAGTMALIVKYVTNKGEGSKVVYLEVINNSRSINVELTPTNIVIGENSFLTLNAPNSGDLYLTIDGKLEKSYGITSYIKVLSNLAVGKHIVSIKFDGRDHYYDYYINSQSYSNTFTITVNAVKTSISSSNVNAVYDTTKSISATLKDNLGNPIVGKTLSLVINKKTYTAKTNANGKATFKVSAKLLPKAYTATIKFAGDKTYAQFIKSIKVTVKKATPKMTAKAKTFRVKVKTKKYSITLKNNNGKVMKNTKVTLKVNKKTFSAKTNSKGIATFKITNLKKKGSFTAVVTYAATKYYNKVVKKPKITVKK